jgi:hypothetical protein
LTEHLVKGHDSMNRLTFAALALTGALACAGPVFAQGSIGGPTKQTRLGGPAKQTSLVPSQKGTAAVPPTAQHVCANCGQKTKK